MAALLDHAAPELRARIVELDTGGRAAGTSNAAEQKVIEDAVFEHRTAERQQLLDRLGGALAREQEAVQGLDDTIGVLRRGQVDELVLHDDPSSTKHLVGGHRPVTLGRTAAGCPRGGCCGREAGAGRRRAARRTGGGGRRHHSAASPRHGTHRRHRSLAALVGSGHAAQPHREHARAR